MFLNLNGGSCVAAKAGHSLYFTAVLSGRMTAKDIYIYIDIYIGNEAIKWNIATV